MEVMKHRKAPRALVFNPEFRHQNKAIILMVSSSFPSKTQFGTFWLYLEQQQDTKGESIVWKHTKHHKIFFFHHQTLCSYPIGHWNTVHKLPMKTLLFFFSAYISMGKLFLHRLHDLYYTILLFCLGPHSHPCHQKSWVIHAATGIASARCGFPFLKKRIIYTTLYLLWQYHCFFQVHMLSDVL